MWSPQPRCRPGVVAIFIALAAALLGASAARAAVGDLTYEECVGGSDACTSTGTSTSLGMRNLSDVVVSPDGRFVYVLAENDSAITWFSRDPATGELTFEDCLSSSTNYQGDCHLTDYSTTGGALTGMGAPVALAISKDADGTNLYTASDYDSAVASFSRDPVTGAVSFLNCISGDDGISNCTTAPPLDSFHTGMESTEDVVVSADGENVYAVSSTDDTVIRLGRSAVDGSLSFGSYTQATGVSDPQGLAISSDDADVYVAGISSVVHLNRSSSDGSLSFGDCITGGTIAGCASVPNAGYNGLDEVWSLEVTPDGGAVYAVSRGDNGLSRFTRNGNGSLTFNGCLSSENDTSCTHFPGATNDGTYSAAWDAESLAISADSQTVYLAGSDGQSIISFNRGSGSSLSFGGCISSNASLSTSCTLTPGASQSSGELYPLRGVALSPDDGSLYTVAGFAGPGTLTHFSRGAGGPDTTPPDTTISSGPSGPIAAKTPSFAFSSSEPGSSFECQLDGAGYAPCTSPKQVGPLGEGDHRFQVRATDAASNTDQSPASREFTVDTKVRNPTVSAAKKQKQKHGKIKVQVKAGAREAVTVTASGKLTQGHHSYKLKGQKKAVGEAKRKLLVLKPKRSKDARKVKQALKHHKAVKAKLTVKLTDALGNKVVEPRTVRLK